MILQSSEAPVQNEESDANVLFLQSLVEDAIQVAKSSTDPYSYGDRLLSDLTTKEEHVDLDWLPYIDGMCTTVCLALAKILKNKGIDVHTAYGAAAKTSHRYLVINTSNEEYIIDPTIGQFLRGYNHIFIGTRDQLQQLVTKITIGQEKRYSIRDFLSQVKKFEPDKIFDAVWSETSVLKDW